MTADEMLRRLLTHFTIDKVAGKLVWNYGEEYLGDIDAELEAECLDFLRRDTSQSTGANNE